MNLYVLTDSSITCGSDEGDDLFGGGGGDTTLYRETYHEFRRCPSLIYYNMAENLYKQ